MLEKIYYAYILASKKNGTLYVGVTSNLIKRVFQHKEGLADGFTKEHGIKTLVYFETTTSAEEAIRREKQIKAWKREWKLNHIEKSNPYWKDLYEELF